MSFDDDDELQYCDNCGEEFKSSKAGLCAKCADELAIKCFKCNREFHYSYLVSRCKSCDLNYCFDCDTDHHYNLDYNYDDNEYYYGIGRGKVILPHCCECRSMLCEQRVKANTCTICVKYQCAACAKSFDGANFYCYKCTIGLVCNRQTFPRDIKQYIFRTAR